MTATLPTKLELGDVLRAMLGAGGITQEVTGTYSAEHAYAVDLSACRLLKHKGQVGGGGQPNRTYQSK